MKPLKINQKRLMNDLLSIALQCVVVLVLFAGLIAFSILTGCAKNPVKDPEIVFKTVNRPVPALIGVPDSLLIDYQGKYPLATPEGEVCFAGDEIKNLQELLQFLNNHNRSLKELLQ